MFLSRMRQIWILTVFAALIMLLGCSGGSNPIAPSDDTPRDDDTVVYEGGTILGEFTLTLDPDNLTGNIEEISRQSGIIVTQYVKIKIVGLLWDPVKRIWDIDLTVENPTKHNAYGPWIVFTETGDQRILDQDGFIWWVTNPGDPPKRVPLIAFCKPNPQRIFNANSIEPVHLRIHWPDWVNNFHPIKFFVDVSYPNPRQHPIVEKLHIFQDSPIPEQFTLNAFIKDWQAPPSGVPGIEAFLDLHPIGGGIAQLFDDGMHGDGMAGDDIWGGQFMAVPPPEPIPLTVHAFDWQRYHFENDVVFGFPGPPPCQPIRRLAEGQHSLIHHPVEKMFMTMDEWTNFWEAHGENRPAPDVDWKTEQVIALMLGDRMTGGYWIRVDCVQFIHDPTGMPVVLVEYTEMIPGESCPTPDVITQPFFFFAIPRYENARADFIKREEVYECPPPECYPFRVLSEGPHSNYHEPIEKLITTQADWHSFWYGHGGTPPPPAVDWTREKVVGLVLGDRPTGGFWIRIDCVRYFEDPSRPPLIQIEYTEMIPGPTCPVPQVITQPHMYIAIPAFPVNAIEFVKHEEVYECPPPPECQPMDVIDEGPHSGIQHPEEVVIRTQNLWHTFWALHKPGHPVPTVDFEKHMVVAIILGERPSTGYFVTIDCVEFRGDSSLPSTHTTYTEHIPGPDCVTAPVITTPYQIVIVPKFHGVDTFTHREKVYSCQPPPDCLPMVLIEKGQWGFHQPLQKVIRTMPEWHQLWLQLHPGTTPPSVDFTKHQIVVVMLGERPSSGFSVHIDCVLDRPNMTPPHSLIMFTEEIPDLQTCDVIWRVHYPYQIVMTPISTAPEEWDPGEHVYICD